MPGTSATVFSKNAPQPVFRKESQETTVAQCKEQGAGIKSPEHRTQSTERGVLNCGRQTSVFSATYMVKVHGLRLELDHHSASSEKPLSPGMLSLYQP